MSRAVAALVPMKGNSERVPNKNLREFNGRPLCNWILHTLRETQNVDEIVVNTDSDEIATEARSFGATVVERPRELQGDYVSMNKIIDHDIGTVDADIYLQTHCTNPLLQAETIDAVIDAFLERECDSVFTVTPLQTRLWDAVGSPINHNRHELKRTQDLPPVFEENSNCYVFTQEAFEKRNNRIGNDPSMFEMAAREAVDIDEPMDFKFAEMLHQDRYGTEPDLETVA